jgi:hypothetical protein
MPKAGVAKGPKGVVAITNKGDMIQVSDPELEKLMAERQRIGRDISKALRQHGLQFGGPDDPTEVIDNSKM